MRNATRAFSRVQRCLCCRLMVLWVVFALAGCMTAPGERQPTPNTLPPTPVGTLLPFTTIAQGDQIRSSPSLDPPKVIIITNAHEIDSALRQAASDPPRLTTSPHPVAQARQIDYTRSFAILALQSGQGTSGYSITVNQVIRQGNQVLVEATFIRPGEHGPEITLSSESDPYHLIAIPKSGTWGEDVRFELLDKGKVVAETTRFIP